MRISDCGFTDDVNRTVLTGRLLALGVRFGIPPRRSDQSAIRNPPLRNLSEAEPRGDLILHARVVAEALEPLDARLAAQPRELALGVVAHVELRLYDCALKCALAAQVFDRAPVAVRAQRA